MSRTLWLGSLSRCLLRSVLAPKQHRYYSSRTTHTTEHVSIRVGGNGYVDLKIHQPRQSTTRSNILLYLPPSIHLPASSSSSSENGSRRLQNGLPNTTILEVDYRLSPRTESEDRRFPTPIHDVFAAWDYTRLMIRDLSSTERSTDSNDPRVCIYGTQLGASLALTLALTEPNSIHAIAIQDPLTDWPVLEELAAHKESTTTPRKQTQRSILQSPEFLKARAEAAESLIKIRTTLFATPSAYFDAFASPTLFLRAPGRDTPLTKTAAPEEEIAVVGEPIRYGDEVDEIGLVTSDSQEDTLAFGPYDDDLHTMSSTTTSPSMPTTSDTSTGGDVQILTETAPAQPPTDLSFWQPTPPQEQPPSPTRRRKVLRKWPSNAHPEDVLLPAVNIFLHELDPMQLSEAGILPVVHTQSLELVELLRRACFWGRERSFAEERVVLTRLDGTNRHAGMGENEVDDEVVRWLRERFEER